MATRRTQIEIAVLGLDDLRSVNTALLTHDKRVQALGATYAGFNASAGSVAASMQRMGQATGQANSGLQQTHKALTDVSNSAGGANRSSGSLLGTLLQFRGVSVIFHGINEAVRATVAGMLEMEKQAARVSRVTGTAAIPVVRAGFAEESSRTGADIKDIGEAYYQLGTQIHNTNDLFGAVQTTMNLVVGTQSDARDTARALLQIYNQFGDSLDQTASKQENFRRIGELLAVTFRDADAEMVDITNALKYLGPIAEAAKVPLEQVTATITALTAEGHRGRMGGTEAAQFISNLIKNYNPDLGGIEKKGLVYHFELGKTANGGIDLQKTMHNIVETANQLPADKARQFLQAISGSQNSFRFLGTSGVEFMRHLDEEVRKSTAAIKGQTHEAELLRQQMTTTAQEFQRAWGGAITAIANMIDASGLKGMIRGWADDLQRFNAESLQIAQATARNSGLMSGGGQYAGDPNAHRQQLMSQRSVLQEMLEAAREKGVSGKISLNESNWGLSQFGHAGGFAGVDLYNQDYKGRTPADRGYLQRFMTFEHPVDDPTHNEITLDLPAMKREYDRLNQELRATSRSAPLRPQDVPSTSTLGLKGLTAAQAENAAIITAAAKKYGVDPLAMISVASYESGLSATNKNAISTATGLFQILRSTAPRIDRTNPYQNAEFAAREIARSGGRGLLGEEAVRLIVDKFEKPDLHPEISRANAIKEIAAANRFYANEGFGGKRSAQNAITESPKSLEKEQKAAEHAAEEAERKAQEAREQLAQRAELEYQRALKQYGPDDARTGAAAAASDKAALAAADANERLRYRYGLTGSVADNQKAAIDARKEAADKSKEAADARNERNKALYTGEGVTKTSLFPFPTEAIDAFQNRADFKAGVANAEYQKQQAKLAQEAKEQALSVQLQGLNEFTDSQIKDAQRAARAGGKFGDPLLRDQAGAQQTVDILQSSMDSLMQQYLQASTEGLPTKELEDGLKQMSERLADANAELAGFKDQLAEREYQRQIKAQDESFDLRAQDINHLHGLRFNKDEDRAFADEMHKLQELLANDQDRLNAVMGETVTGQTPERIREAQKRLKEDQQRLSDYPVEYGNRKYAETYNQVRNELQGSLMSFFHGKGDVSQVARGLGDTIVNSALEQQIKKFSDPLVTTVTQQILEIQGNTQALKSLTAFMNGTASSADMSNTGMAQAVQAGVSGAVQDFGWGPVSTAGGSSSGKSAGVAGAGRQSDLQKGISAGLGAYSIFSGAQQQGANAGNFLGGIISGASIGSTFGPGGGLIGGIVGGAIDLIGGLFHHKDKPTATPQDLNPSMYNSPSGFDLAAYNYSAYGKLPTMQDVGFDVKAANTPTVNVFVDGAKVAARQEVQRQTSSIAVNLTNTVMDRHAPI